MTQAPKPDLAEYEQEAISFEQVMKRLIEAKPKQRAKRKDLTSTDGDAKPNSPGKRTGANDS